MQDTRTNELRTAESLDELREQIPETDRGPTFELGEIIRIKGYYYRVAELATGRLVFAPHGPSKKGLGHKDDGEKEYKPRRRGQR